MGGKVARDEEGGQLGGGKHVDQVLGAGREDPGDVNASNAGQGAMKVNPRQQTDTVAGEQGADNGTTRMNA